MSETLTNHEMYLFFLLGLVIGSFLNTVIYRLPFMFEYDIVDPNGLQREHFTEEFFTLIGDILVDIMDGQLKEDNLEYISTDD